jgi:hypothetical protein
MGLFLLLRVKLERQHGFLVRAAVLYDVADHVVKPVALQSGNADFRSHFHLHHQTHIVSYSFYSNGCSLPDRMQDIRDGLVG